MLNSFGIGGYRSFGPETQIVAPLGRINVFIGLNSSGKSNILGFLRWLELLPLQKGKGLPERPDAFDFHLSGDNTIRFGLSIPIDELEASFVTNKTDAQLIKVVQRVLDVWPKTPDQKQALIWLSLSRNAPSSVPIESEFQDEIASKCHEETWAFLSERLGQTRGNVKTNVRRVIQHVLTNVHLFSTKTIAAVREVNVRKQSDGYAFGDDNFLTGDGIVKKLFEAQEPPLARIHEQADHEALVQFVRDLLEDDEANIRVPHDLSEIKVTLHGKQLQLRSLGTGIHEVVLLAAAATLFKDHTLLVEEPELHLHPTLQRKLMHYWATKTQNRYFITTHSAQIIDSPHANVFHVWVQDKSSRVEPVNSRAVRSTVCASLGYCASDIVQANAIVWVEGPSDRVYIRHWLKVRELTEGVHYSIMWYGGKLVSRLSPYDEEQLAEQTLPICGKSTRNRNFSLSSFRILRATLLPLSMTILSLSAKRYSWANSVSLN